MRPHPSLALVAFVARFPRALGELESPHLDELLADPAACLERAPVARDEGTRKCVRDLLRHGGYKPTGRGKPSSEYLVRAADEGRLASINPAVDAGNLVSLASGLPISVVDLERLTPPLEVGLAKQGTRYVFNPSGQEIDVSGLLCLFDAEGPCANAVKDAQRSKTDGETSTTLSVLWSPASEAKRRDATLAWYRSLLEEMGATTHPIGPLP